MKSTRENLAEIAGESLPVWGEWIEIVREQVFAIERSLSPCGESGLKLKQDLFLPRLVGLSLPVWGEWIEIFIA